ncbi:MAG: UDP-N-acetylglucosamine 2-epimerase [Gammaproteobacteria bacterium]|nr:UDP-N-acetylglucosamine 2-epimerase [Gammaproteobacteria bacterium]
MINCIIGTRAQLIKMAPVLLALERDKTPYRLIFTGQHKTTMHELLDEFGVQTAPVILYDGGEITGVAHMGRWFFQMLWRGLRGRGRLLGYPPHERNCVLIHGDTISTLLGALMGRFARCEVAHVEAGLTSGRLLEPFPEEVTRRLVFRLADVAFCPGPWAMSNMRRFRARPVDTGANTIVDAVREAMQRFDEAVVEVPETAYAVVSLHRFENIFRAERFTFIIEALERIAERIRLVFVLHPATAKQAEKFGLLERLKTNASISLYPRMTYLSFLKLLSQSTFVITDGGSNQEELSYLHIPTLLMRATTERKEGLDDNVVISSYDSGVIERFVDDAMAGSERVPGEPGAQRPSEIIARDLKQNYTKGG